MKCSAWSLTAAAFALLVLSQGVAARSRRRPQAAQAAAQQPQAQQPATDYDYNPENDYYDEYDYEDKSKFLTHTNHQNFI